MSRFAQEKDPEILHKAIDLLQNHNRALATKIAELLKELAEAKGDSGFQQMRIAALEKSLAKLTKEIFGPSTEQRPAGATANGNDEDDKSKDEKKKRPGHGPTEQPKLPIVDVVHKLDDADTADLFTEVSRGTDKNLWFVAGYGVNRHLPDAGTRPRLNFPETDRLLPLFDPRAPLTSTGFANYFEDPPEEESAGLKAKMYSRY